MNVVGYARVSTENQLENYSIEEQCQRLSAYCQAKGWRLLNTYVDGGCSGSSLDRPALKELLNAVSRGGVDAVVVYKLDRLSRSQKDTLLLIEDRFLANGTDFISINENFDTSTPFGRAMIGMLSVFAQLERDQITERFTMGRVGRGKAGYFHGGGNPPTGYDYSGGLLHVNEYQALQVREAYRMFLSGSSIHQVARRLSEKYSPSWTAAKVRSVLKNSLYIGKVHFKGQEYQGLHQPIIDPDSFREANRLLAAMPRRERSPFRAKYLLSGILCCACCGSRFAACHGEYKCYSRSKSSPKYVRDPCCPNRDWPIPLLDSLVLGEVGRLLSNQRALALLASGRPAPPPSDAGRVQARLAELDAQLDRLAELYQLGGIPEEILARRTQALSKEREAFVGQAADQPPSREPERTDFFTALQKSPLEVQRAFLHTLIEDIALDGGQITIQWKI